MKNAIEHINENLVRINFADFSLDEIIRGLVESDYLNQNKWLQSAIASLKDFGTLNKLSVTSSGTTGEPKSFEFSYEDVKFSASQSLKYFDLKAGDEVFCPLSCDFIGGKMMLFRALFGKLVLWLAKPEGDVLASIPANRKFKFTPLVPMQLEQTFSQSGPNELMRLGQILLGGATVSDALLTQVSILRNSVFHSFGMSETLSHVAIKSLSKGDEFYKALPGYHFSTQNECLVIYNESWMKEGFETKDIVELQSAKEFKWKGRSDNLINSGGVKFQAESIEAKISLELSDVQCSFVITALPDPKLGEKIVLVSEGKDFSVFHERLKQELSKYESPKQFFTLASFPRTQSGKIKRQKIREMISQLP